MTPAEKRDVARNMTREIAVLHAVACLGHLPKVIVETGTTREPTGFGTRYLGALAKKAGGTLFSIDSDASACRYCEKILPEDLRPFVCVEYSRSIEWFKMNVYFPVDLLYLDSAYDANVTRAETEAAIPMLAEDCAVVIDDCERGPAGPQGKGTLAIPYLLSFGFKVKYFSGGKKTVAVLWRTK